MSEVIPALRKGDGAIVNPPPTSEQGDKMIRTADRQRVSVTDPLTIAQGGNMTRTADRQRVSVTDPLTIAQGGNMTRTADRQHIGVGKHSTSEQGVHIARHTAQEHVSVGEPSLLTQHDGMIQRRLLRADGDQYDFTNWCIEWCRLEAGWDATPDLDKQLAALLEAWWNDPEAEVASNQEYPRHELEMLARHCTERIIQLRCACFLMRRKPVRECQQVTYAAFLLKRIGRILGNETLDAMIPQAEEKLRMTVLYDYWRSKTPKPRGRKRDRKGSGQPAAT
jgi:hypothetical protein